MRTATRTYVILELSGQAYQEIKEKLEASGYQHAFHQTEGRIVIDLHGIAVAQQFPDGATLPEAIDVLKSAAEII